MKTITLLNEKGGVGKTTLAVHIAAGLAIRGHQVVIIDADPQGNTTSAVGLDKRPDFYDLIVREAPWRDLLRPVHPDVYAMPQTPPEGRLFAVSGNHETRNIANSISKNTIIRRRFLELQNAIDYIVVDTSPTPSLLHAAVALATDYMVIPTDCEAFSALEGLPDSIAHADYVRSEVKQYKLDVAQVIGIVPNKYRRKTVLHNDVLKHLRETYGDLVWEPLPLATVITEAQLVRQFLFGYAPDHAVTKSIWQLIDNIEKVVELG